MRRPLSRFAALAILLLWALLSPPAAACIWDEDTASAEARGLPEVVEIIAGRFERNPPLYYEMRLERAKGRIARNPGDLEAFDDAGAACDRLGRGDEAINWMARKKAVLDAMPAKDARVMEHRYRYLANLGTFHAHRWVRAGAHRDDRADLVRSRELIAEAIKLNPQAHFGRERYQLMAIDGMIESGEGDGQTLPTFLARSSRGGLNECMNETGSNGRLAKMGLGDAVEGLTGLIALGNAWESVDVFWALALVLQCDGRSSIAALAAFRAHELVEKGKPSLLVGPVKGVELDGDVGRGIPPKNFEELDAYYKAARASADEWQARRQAFMMAKLAAGKHPDTDDDFWRGFDDGPPPPVLPGGRFWGFEGFARTHPVLAVLAIALGAWVLLKLLKAWSRRRR